MPVAVLADACILVKDVVSASLFDLHAAGIIELYWTPEIEAEYIEHRARIRAEQSKRAPTDQDLLWATSRIEAIKLHLVKQSTPPGWVFETTLDALASDPRYTPLQAMKDKDDIHVASAAGYLAQALGRSIVLVSDNLDDLPEELLTPLNVALMHQGDLLEVLHNANPKAVSQSLLKTSADFKNPPIPPEAMIVSIESRNQFCNPELAEKLAKDWGVARVKSKAKAKGKAGKGRGSRQAGHSR